VTKTLEMVFKSSDDKSVRISIDNARGDLTPAEVKAVMDKIIAESIFNPGNAQLVIADSAAVVTVSTEELELV